jgi:hypothetical protein
MSGITETPGSASERLRTVPIENRLPLILWQDFRFVDEHNRDPVVDAVAAADAVSRVQQPVSRLTVVAEDQQPFRHQIQSSDVEEVIRALG